MTTNATKIVEERDASSYAEVRVMQLRAENASLHAMMSLYRAENAELREALERTYALPFAPSNNGEQWDEGYARGWNSALNQVYDIARAALAWRPA